MKIVLMFNRMTVKRPHPLILIGVLYCCSASFALAQSPNSRTIRGTVSDPRHARIAGATITISNSELRRQAVSDDTGSFQVTLPDSTYRVVVTAQGFQDVVLESFRISSRSASGLRIQMKVKPPQMPLKIESTSRSVKL